MSSKSGAFRLERIRSFGGHFTDLKRILRENLSSFLGVLVLVIGPFVLITCTINIYYVNYIFDNKSIFEYENVGSFLAFTSLFSQFRSLLNGLFTAFVISHFLKVCREKGSSKFTINDVTSSLRKDLVMGGLIYSVLMISCLIIGVSIVALLLWLSSFSVVAMGFVSFIGAIVYMILRYPFWYIVFSIFMARTSSAKIRFFESFRLSFQVFRGHWWRTWVILFSVWALLLAVSHLITSTSSFGMQILDLFSLKKDFDTVTTKMADTIFTTIGEFARTLVNSVFCVAVGIHFYSLKEHLFGDTITEQLDQIGHTKPDDNVEYMY